MRKFLFISFTGFIFLFFLVGISIGILSYNQPEKVIQFLSSLHPTPTQVPLSIKGIGVIGDSLSDEYRADDSRGLTYASTTKNWVELLSEYRHLPFGDWGVYEEPRREGYAYNDARTGENIEGAINAGQHIELAQQIRSGKVNLVIIYLGVNDFSPLAPEGYEAIYTGSVSDAEITRKVNRLTADVETIIETLKKAGDVSILFITIPDWGDHALIQLAFPDPTRREWVSTAIATANEKIGVVAKNYHVTIADISTFYTELKQRTKGDAVVIGKEKVHIFLPGDDPRDLFLDDGVHPGTMYNGLFANFVITNLNSQMGTHIRPFSDQEIVSMAGL